MDSLDVVEDQLLFNESANVPDITATMISYLFGIFGGSLSVLIMCGNLVVIMSIIYFKQLHSPTNFLMLSLAVADLLVGLLVVPFSLVLVLSSYWSLHDVLCQVRGILDVILCSSSIWNLCFISVDRYYAVCQPLRYRTRISVRVVGIMIVVSWTIATLNAVIFASKAPDEGPKTQKCVFVQRKAKSTMIVASFFSFGFPAIIMASIYLKILIVAKKQARSIKSMSKSGAAVSKMEKKATKTLSIVMGIFLLSWLPFCFCMSFYPLTNYTIPVDAIQSLKWLGWSNSMLNPFVYAFFYSWFRSAFTMIITGKIFKCDFSNSKLF